MSFAQVEQFFNPKSIAVIGASNNPDAHGHNHFNFQRCYGFSGQLYPVNPNQKEVLGHRAYPSLADIPYPVEHVIVAVGIQAVPDILDQAAKKGVKSIHVYAGRASETGRPEAKKLDELIQTKVKQYGIRLVGPNALGMFCPKSGLAFGYDFPPVPGKVGGIMQSGANSSNLCHFALHRGVNFSKVASYGNAMDLNETDFWEYFIDDPETEIIVSYNEAIKGDTKKYLELVTRAAKKKPVVICKGGRTPAGGRFTIGHTNSNAAADRDLFLEPIRKTGAVVVRNIDEMLDMAVAFGQLPPVKGNRLGLGGGGGGDCVLNTDMFEEAGFVLPELPQGIHEEFKKKGSQMWDWIKNPGDFSIVGPNDPFTVPALLEEMSKYSEFDLLCGYVGEDFPFKIDGLEAVMLFNIEGYINVFKTKRKPFFAVVRSRALGVREMEGQRHRIYAKIRTRFLQEGLPFFESVDSAALAVRRQMEYYQKRG
jgi:acyl-CoA synthetase (NDP forming)